MRLLRPVLILAALPLLLATPAAAAAGYANVPASRVPTTYDTTTKVPAHYATVSLGTLYHDVASQRVSTATMDPTQDLISFVVAGHHDVTQYLDASGPSISSYLLAHGVNLTIGSIVIGSSSASSPAWGLLLFVFLLLGVLAGVIVRQRRRARAQTRALENGDTLTLAASKNGPGAAHGNLVRAEVPTTRFADVAGCDEAIADMGEFVEILSNPDPFIAVGATIPSGALLVGPPGTGKTLLARAVAGEAGVPIYAVNGSDFAEIYVGAGAKRVRELFARARSHGGPAIIFIDEIDAVARRRSPGANPGDSEREQTLNQLLGEMDGFRRSKTSTIIVLAATNRLDMLDPAVTRPGRLDRQIQVPLPDRRGRERILAVHARTRPISPEVSFEALSRSTSGMSGASLEQVVNEACILAGRERVEVVTNAHFASSLATVSMGRARTSAVVTERDRLITAWHEAGHTVCAYVQPAGDRPSAVSIIPRGPAGGVTWMDEGDDQMLQRSKAAARLVTALGGRAAEIALLGDDYTQGAYGDLTTATQLAYAMVTRYGMTDLGLVVRDPDVLGPAAHEGVIDVVQDMLAAALAEAQGLLESHQDFAQALVTALLENDTLNAQEITEVYQSVVSPSPVAQVILPGRVAQPAPSAAPRPAVTAAPRVSVVPPVRTRRPRERAWARVAAFAARRARPSKSSTVDLG